MLLLLAVRLVDETTGFLGPGSIERFRADLGIDYTVAGGMFASAMAGGLLAALAVSATDGRNRKWLTVSGVFTVAAGLVVLAGAVRGPTLLLATAIVAGGSTCMVHGGEIAVAHAVEDRHLERALSRTNLLAAAGDVLGPVLLAGSRAIGIGWRPLFLGVAAATAAYGALLARATFPPPRPVPDAPEGEATPRVAAGVVALGLAAFTLMPMDESYLGTVLAFAERDRHVSPAVSALLGVAFVSGGTLAFTVLVGWVSRRHPADVLAVAAVGMTAAVVVGAHSPAWVLVPVGVVQSALLGSTWLALQTAVLRSSPGREGRAKLIVEVFESAAVLVVLGAGAVADRHGLVAAQHVYALSALALVGPAVLVRRRSHPPRRR